MARPCRPPLTPQSPGRRGAVQRLALPLLVVAICLLSCCAAVGDAAQDGRSSVTGPADSSVQAAPRYDIARKAPELAAAIRRDSTHLRTLTLTLATHRSATGPGSPSAGVAAFLTQNGVLDTTWSVEASYPSAGTVVIDVYVPPGPEGTQAALVVLDALATGVLQLRGRLVGASAGRVVPPSPPAPPSPLSPPPPPPPLKLEPLLDVAPLEEALVRTGDMQRRVTVKMITQAGKARRTAVAAAAAATAFLRKEAQPNSWDVKAAASSADTVVLTVTVPSGPKGTEAALLLLRAIADGTLQFSANLSLQASVEGVEAPPPPLPPSPSPPPPPPPSPTPEPKLDLIAGGWGDPHRFGDFEGFDGRRFAFSGRSGDWVDLLASDPQSFRLSAQYTTDLRNPSRTVMYAYRFRSGTKKVGVQLVPGSLASGNTWEMAVTVRGRPIGEGTTTLRGGIKITNKPTRRGAHGVVTIDTGSIKVTIVQAWRRNRKASASYLDVNIALLSPLKPRVTGLLAASYNRALDASA